MMIFLLPLLYMNKMITIYTGNILATCSNTNRYAYDT